MLIEWRNKCDSVNYYWCNYIISSCGSHQADTDRLQLFLELNCIFGIQRIPFCTESINKVVTVAVYQISVTVDLELSYPGQRKYGGL